VRDFCRGGSEFASDRPGFNIAFDRLQLNFHASPHEVEPAAFGSTLRTVEPPQGYIFQFDGANDGLLRLALAAGVKAAPLFDLSGGAGRLPDSWPIASQPYSGYAGGLSPENLREQLALIAEAAGEERVWIDVETHVRSGGDRQFDLGKVERFLEIAEPWVGFPVEVPDGE
jgi:phosphoribosylanthranilate isomerase